MEEENTRDVYNFSDTKAIPDVFHDYSANLSSVPIVIDNGESIDIFKYVLYPMD